MDSINSITSEVSPKLQVPLPTKHSIEAEAKRCRPPLCSPGNSSLSNFQKIVAELIGTYVLIFVGCGSALTDQLHKLTILGIAFVWGGVLMADIYAVGHISGAHFNPAVSLALAAIRKFSWKHVPMYVLAQLLGATLASLTLKVLFHDKVGVAIEAIMTQYSDPTSDLQAILWEFIITFILMFCICGVATDDRANKSLAGVAIGGVLLVNVLIAGPITGASMNPARSLGPAIVSGVYTNIWVYLVAPIAGAMVAAAVYSILQVHHAETPDGSPKSVYNNDYLYAEP